MPSKDISATLFKSHNFYDLKVSNFKFEELEPKLKSVVADNKHIGVFGYSLGYIAELSRQPKLFNMINDCELMLTDGRYFYLLLKWFRFSIECEMSIPQFVYFILDFAERNRLSLMLVGGTEETNRKAFINISKKYPNIKLLPGNDGYFDNKETNSVVKKIVKAAPNILLLGMSTPKKEEFYANYKDELSANIVIPCGGMIDVLSGKIKATPNLFKKLGFATLFRVIQEPRRMLGLNLWYAYHVLFMLLPQMIVHVKIKRESFSFREFYQL